MKILRIITRLNIGGPAQQAVALSARLDHGRFRSVLVTGPVGDDEGDFGFLVEQQGVRRLVIPELQRALHPWRDLLALCALLRLIWKEQPDLIHTHMAKAGTLGRLAGVIYNLAHPGHRIRLLHTFHGHVLEGYFSSVTSRLFTWIERGLAHWTDRLIVVSEAVRAELLGYGIGRPERAVVIPVGLPLEPFLAIEPSTSSEPLFRLGMVGRLVPIKQPELFLEGVDRLRALMPARPVAAVIVGDGPARAALEQQVNRLGLAQVVAFHGWRFDLADVYRSVDVVCLTSRNEGTPLSIIEAMAAARPVVATDVGGVRDLFGAAASAQPHSAFHVRQRGLLVRSGDAEGLAQALRFLAEHPAQRRELGLAGREHVRHRFTTERLTRDLQRMYEALCPPKDTHDLPLPSTYPAWLPGIPNDQIPITR